MFSGKATMTSGSHLVTIMLLADSVKRQRPGPVDLLGLPVPPAKMLRLKL